MAKRVWHVLRLTIARWSRNDGNLLAAAMAYYSAFSFFPLLMVLISALGFALRVSASAQNAQYELLHFLATSTAPGLADEVRSILNEVQTRAAINGWLGLATLLLGAIGIFSQLESAFDRLWQTFTLQDRGVWAAIRGALWNRLVAFLTLIGLGLLVLLAFVAGIALRAVEAWADDFPGGPTLWQVGQQASSVSLDALVLLLLYKMIPRAPVRWRDAAWGAVFVSVTWQLGSQVVSRFVVGNNYSAYGVVGSFIAMMLWVYYASVLLFLGAQLVQVLGNPEELSGPPNA